MSWMTEELWLDSLQESEIFCLLRSIYTICGAHWAGCPKGIVVLFMGVNCSRHILSMCLYLLLRLRMS